MIFLDTDHLTLLKYPESPQYAALVARMEASPDQEIGTTIVSVEEQWRGWLAILAAFATFLAMSRHTESSCCCSIPFQRWTILPFDEEAAAEYARLRAAGIRIGTMDLKIASITLVHQALLLSANLSDFRKVPGLHVENWLD